MKLDTGVVPVDEQTYHAVATTRDPRPDEGMEGLPLAMSSIKAASALSSLPGNGPVKGTGGRSTTRRRESASLTTLR